MLYYGVITASVIMFGLQFFFNQRYQRESGSGVGATFLFAFGSNLVGLLFLLVINRFSFGFTPFTFLMAGLAALNSLLYTFCSLKAFEHINLSLYSIFAMLGGMLLPFVAGLLFFDEPMTVGKGICVVLIITALLLTIERGSSKSGWIYYAGVFVLNGMSGVLSKIFQAVPYAKTNAAVYSIWMALISAVLSGVILLFLWGKWKRPGGKALLYTAGYGGLNKVANFLLLIALAVLPASVQYPFVTGGTMIASTVIALCCGQCPSKREILSVALSFAGILILVLVP
ncbi:MAG: DMT family transporter [Clostridia bacterium]|nr:DMT family transporter [Clostridia bacterium]